MHLLFSHIFRISSPLFFCMHIQYFCSPRPAYSHLLMVWSGFHVMFSYCSLLSLCSYTNTCPSSVNAGSWNALQLHHLQVCPNEIWLRRSKLLQTKWNCHMFLTVEMTVWCFAHSSGWYAPLDLQNVKEKHMPEATVLQAFASFSHFPWNSNEVEALKDQPCTDMVCQLL